MIGFEDVFPEGADKTEREFKWQELGVVNESDLPLERHLNNLPEPARFDVRVLLKNDQGEVCLVLSGKYGYGALPGGSIEPEETVENAARREAREETGYTLKNLTPVGRFIEMRYPAPKIVFVYSAQADENVGTNYMEDELAEEFYPSWKTMDDAIQFFQDEDDKLAQMDEKSYNGTFANRRDLTLLKRFKENDEKT